MSKISELSDGGALLSTDDLIVVRSGGNVRAQLSSLNGIAIGSSTPAAGTFTTLVANTSLTVNGSMSLDGAVSAGAITVDHTDGTDNISLTPTSTGGVLNVRNGSGTSVIALDGRNGQAGIDVTGSVTASTSMLVGDGEAYGFGDNSYRIEGKDDGTNARLGFVAGGSERMRLTTTGLGIGTSSPDTLLELVGADPILTIRDSDTSSGTANATLRLAESGASDSLGAYWDIKAVGGQLQFIDNWNEGGGTGTRVVIDDSGNVGIGSSSATYRMNVQGSSTETNNSFASGVPGLTLTNNSATDGTYSFLAFSDTDGGGGFTSAIQGKTVSQSANTGKLNFFTRSSTGFAERMTIDSGGQLFLFTQTSGAGNSTLKYTTGTGAVTFDTSSRLVKENIEDIPYGLSAVMSLSPKKYRRTDSNNKEEVGFIADEMLEVIPEIVGMMKKSVFTGEEQDAEEVAGSVEYEKLTAVLTKAIQEQQTLIESLTDRIAALEK